MAKPVFPYQSLAREPKFREAASRKITNDELHLLADALGYSCGLTTVQKARKLATKSEPKPVATADEWTVPTSTSSTRIAEVVEAKRAPSQGNLWQRFVVVSDLHGDMMHDEANKVMFDFVENSWKPQIRICAGDLFDFRALRRGASIEERSENMQPDYLAGQAWAMRFFATGCKNHFLRGNHDERLWDLRHANDAVMRQFGYEKSQNIEHWLKGLNVQMLPYHKRDGVLQIGSLKVLHGFNSGVYACRQTALTYGSAVMGHVHSVDSHCIAGLERRSARSIGCMCALDMDYSSRQPNSLRHSHGFAYGILQPQTGEYHLWQAESFGGVWAMASDVVLRGDNQ